MQVEAHDDLDDAAEEADSSKGSKELQEKQLLTWLGLHEGQSTEDSMQFSQAVI